MDADEQELQEIQSAFTCGLAASDEEYRTQMNALSALHDQQLQGAMNEEQRRISWEQYYQKKDALLQECIERDREIIAIHAQRMKALEDRLCTTPSDIISPFWRVRVTHIAEEVPSHIHHFFQRTLEIYSIEALREFLCFFLNHPDETRLGSPIELEIIRVTREESVIYLKGREEEDRAVYHVDFRQSQQRDLIGHHHLQNEVIGAWVNVGGQFIHRVTDYNDRGRPIRHQDRRHRPIPKEYREY